MPLLELTMKYIACSHFHKGSFVLCIGVFVVINNPEDTDKEIRTSNRDTQKTVERLARRMPEHIHLEAIDLWSEGHAPEKCNVGIAREAGVQVAFKHLKSDGIIINTDADTVLENHYVHTAITKFDSDPDLSAVVGSLDLDIDESDPEANIGTSIMAINHRLKRIFESMYKSEVATPIEDKSPRYASGANMVVRASTYSEVGGYNALGAGEDSDLIKRICDSGHKAEHSNVLRVKTSSRMSDRTDYGFGKAIRRTAESKATSFSFNMVSSREAEFTAHRLIDQIKIQRKEKDPDVWKNRLREAMYIHGIELTKKQLKSLWKVSRGTTDIPNYRMSIAIRMKVDQILAGKFEKVTVLEAAKEALHHLSDIGDIDGIPLFTDFDTSTPALEHHRQGFIINGRMFISKVDGYFNEAAKAQQEDIQSDGEISESTYAIIDHATGIALYELRNAVEAMHGFKRIIAVLDNLKELLGQYPNKKVSFLKKQVAIFKCQINGSIALQIDIDRMQRGWKSRNPFDLIDSPETMAAGVQIDIDQNLGKGFEKAVAAKDSALNEMISFCREKGAPKEIKDIISKLEEEVSRIATSDLY